MGGRMIIRSDEWLAELLAMSPQRSGLGWTVKEWADQLKCSERIARTRLQEAQGKGLLVHEIRDGVGIDGRRIAHNVYRIEKRKT